MVSVAATAADQAVAIEDGMYDADRRRRDVVVEPSQLLADLGCAPTRVLGRQSSATRNTV
jgi:hypothetical protein